MQFVARWSSAGFYKLKVPTGNDYWHLSDKKKMSSYLTGKNHILKFLLGIIAYAHPPPPPRHHHSHVTDFTLETRFLSLGSSVNNVTGWEHDWALISGIGSTNIPAVVPIQKFNPLSTGLKRLERETELTPFTLEMRGVKPPLLNTCTAGSTLWRHTYTAVLRRGNSDTTSCRLADTCQGFDEICCFHLQGRRPCISR